MGLKPDHWIRKMALEQRMIEPFVDGQVSDGVISYGLSSYGYDIRVSDEFKIFQPEVTASKLSDVQCSYIAGLLDAQGEIKYEASEINGRQCLTLAFNGRDRQLLESIQTIVGTGQLRGPDDELELVVSKTADVRCILSQVLPYLTRQRDAASRALAELKSSKSIVVDPKNFDADSFVDFKGDICVIPPNSFALGRTVEYFRIPRSVLTICVGKSSYARCFRGDTRVALVDGTAPTLEEMAKRAQDGELFWGYSIGRFGRIIVTLLEAPRYIGRGALVKLELDNGECIHCTPDHRFILRNGRSVEARDLCPGESLMPLHRQWVRGYESVYQPLSGHLHPTHRLADEWNLRHKIYGDEPGTHRHHIDLDKRNNNPWNLTRMPAEEHIALETVREALDEAGSIRGAARLLDCDRSVFRRSPDIIAAFHGSTHSHSRDRKNHRVVAIRELPGEHDVFCCTVPEAGNFALQSGVFVHNCGVIVNVTPFEPSWAGHVTLEISNTTPLPAKIYANEGIAQVLFFEGDEECEVSYAERKGKYHKQQGVTLPRL